MLEVRGKTADRGPRILVTKHGLLHLEGACKKVELNPSQTPAQVARQEEREGKDQWASYIRNAC